MTQRLEKLAGFAGLPEKNVEFLFTHVWIDFWESHDVVHSSGLTRLYGADAKVERLMSFIDQDRFAAISRIVMVGEAVRPSPVNIPFNALHLCDAI